jgi:hypothetical protein
MQRHNKQHGDRTITSEVDKVKRQVRKAVFPVAGLGTRFLPATKASPKEMLPIVDKPLIQYAVEEAVAAGVETLVFIIGRTKNAIADHFDKAYELEVELETRGKTELLQIVRNIVPPRVECVYVRQAEALGLGHAVLCARPVVGNEPFAVILADDLIAHTPFLATPVGKNLRGLMRRAGVMYRFHDLCELGDLPFQTSMVRMEKGSWHCLEIAAVSRSPSPTTMVRRIGITHCAPPMRGSMSR